MYFRDFLFFFFFFFFSSRRRHTRSLRDWSSDVCSSDLITQAAASPRRRLPYWSMRYAIGADTAATRLPRDRPSGLRELPTLAGRRPCTLHRILYDGHHMQRSAPRAKEVTHEGIVEAAGRAIR